MDRMEPILRCGHQMQNMSLSSEISTSGGQANTRSLSERTILGSEGFIRGPTRGSLYKYHVESKAHLGYSMDKGDPFALHWEIPSRTASIVWDLKHSWSDAEWMSTRADK